jgi:hypothetical protein
MYIILLRNYVEIGLHILLWGEDEVVELNLTLENIYDEEQVI